MIGRVLQVFVIGMIFSAIVTSWAVAEEVRSPTVGAPGRVEGVILPGPELVPKPIVDRLQPVVVRILNAFPHGDSFRYDIQFHGMEPGEYDLTDFLMREDGTETGELPEVKVEIRSLLPPGQIQPNALSSRWWPGLGGYKTVAIVAVVLWGAGLLALIFVGRKRKIHSAAANRKQTLAELLKDRLQAATKNELPTDQYAELERMLQTFWRKRLNLNNFPHDEAIRRMRKHEQSGPLMMQLERWMHSPNRDETVDLGKLLEPYENIPVDDLDDPA